MCSVLVVEDDHDTRVSLRSVLEAEGCRVMTVTNGSDGLELLKKVDPPNVILLDQLLPMMDGTEFIDRQMRDEELSRIPVVLISAVPQLARGKTIRGYMRKPLDLSVLLRHVKECCRESHPEGQGICLES